MRDTEFPRSTARRAAVLLVAGLLAASPIAMAGGDARAAVATWIQITNDADDWHTVSGAALPGNVVIIGEVGAANPAVGHFAFTVERPPFVRGEPSVAQAVLSFTAANTFQFPGGPLYQQPLRFTLWGDQPCATTWKPGGTGGIPSACGITVFDVPVWQAGNRYEVDVTDNVRRLVAELTSRRTGAEERIEFSIMLQTQDGAAIQVVAHDYKPTLAAALSISWE